MSEELKKYIEEFLHYIIKEKGINYIQEYKSEILEILTRVISSIKSSC